MLLDAFICVPGEEEYLGCRRILRVGQTQWACVVLMVRWLIVCVCAVGSCAVRMVPPSVVSCDLYE